MRIFIFDRPSSTEALRRTDCEAICAMAREARHFLRTKVYGSTITYGSFTTWSGTNNYNNSNPRTLINSFYASLSPTSALRQNAVTHDATSKLGVYDKLNAAIGMSTPSEIIAVGTTDVAFALSAQEAASYCSAKWFNGSYISVSSAEALSNWERLKSKGDAGSTHYMSWLRTIGINTTQASVLDAGGFVGTLAFSYNRNVRPALWVKSDIIDNLP